MLTWSEFAVAITITLTLSLAVVAVIRPALYAVLKALCGTEIGANFWIAYATIMLVVGPLYLVAGFAVAGEDWLHAIRSTLSTASLGLIGAFVIMGAAVWSATPSARLEKPAPTGQPGTEG